MISGGNDYYSGNMQVNPYCGIQDPTNTILAAGVFTALELWRLSKGINQYFNGEHFRIVFFYIFHRAALNVDNTINWGSQLCF